MGRANEVKGIRASVDVGGVLVIGREFRVREAVTVPEFASFTFPAPAQVALTVRRLGRGLHLKGTIDAEPVGECARCLDDVRFALHLNVDEPLEGGGEPEHPFADNNVLSGDELDLGDLVRQSIDSALPLVSLCRPDCRGLCSECGYKKDGPCGCLPQE